MAGHTTGVAGGNQIRKMQSRLKSGTAGADGEEQAAATTRSQAGMGCCRRIVQTAAMNCWDCRLEVTGTDAMGSAGASADGCRQQSFMEQEQPLDVFPESVPSIAAFNSKTVWLPISVRLNRKTKNVFTKLIKLDLRLLNRVDFHQVLGWFFLEIFQTAFAA